MILLIIFMCFGVAGATLWALVAIGPMMERRQRECVKDEVAGAVTIREEE